MSALSDDSQVYLASYGRFHAFSLATEFAKERKLGGIYCADRHLFPPPGVTFSRYHNKLSVRIRELVAKVCPSLYQEQFQLAQYQQWLGRKMLRLRGGVFHGWNGHIGGVFNQLDPQKWLRCVERSCPYNWFQYNLLQDEARFLGLPFRESAEQVALAVQELHCADIIVAPSIYSARSYADVPQLACKVRVNPLGSNFGYEEKVRGADTIRVLAVGNNFMRKGFHYLIEAIGLLRSPNISLIIRGDVPSGYRKRIGDSRVTILPPMRRRELRKLFEAADIFCVPSIDEGFGMVALEALALGLPLVITEHVGAADVLSPIEAQKVPIRNGPAIAQAIESILSWTRSEYAHFDETRRQTIAMNSWHACALRMLRDVYVSARPRG